MYQRKIIYTKKTEDEISDVALPIEIITNTSPKSQQYNEEDNLFNKIQLKPLLYSIKHKLNNPKLNILIDDLINFRKNCHQKNTKLKLKPIPGDNVQLFYHQVLKNIIEIIYIRDTFLRENRINNLFLWYRSKIKMINDLKKINELNFKPQNVIDAMDYCKLKFGDYEQKKNEYIPITDKIKEELQHRNREAHNMNIAKDFKRHVLKINPKGQVRKSESCSNITGNKLFSSEGKYSIYNFKKTNINNNFQMKEINKSNIIQPVKVNPYSNISSASLLDDKINKKIMESKNEELNEKRSQEEIEKKLNEFAINKARYRENELKKYEMKKMIEDFEKNNSSNTSITLQKNNNAEISTNFETNNEENTNVPRYLTKSCKMPLNVKFKDAPINKPKENDNYDNKSKENSSPVFFKLKRCSTKVLSVPEKALFALQRKKVIISDVKNMNYFSKKIIDNPEDEIIKGTINIKNPKIELDNKLVNNNIGKEKTPADSIFKLIIHDPVYKEKMLIHKICNIPLNSNKNQEICNSADFCQKYKKIPKLGFTEKNDEANKKKFILKNSILDKNKILNDSYLKNKNNLLNLRKSLGYWKQKEYKIILDKISKNKGTDESINNYSANMYNGSRKFLIDFSNNEKNENSFVSQKIIHRYNEKENSLKKALLNPNDANTFSSMFLPRSGSMLLPKVEVRKVNIK